MSQNVNTIYNYLIVSDSTNDTTTTLNNTSINFGSNLLTTPLNTNISNSGINTPLGNIGFAEMILIRDATQAISIPIPNDSTTLKVVDTVEVASQVNPIGATKTDYSYDSITASNGLTINGATTFTSVPKSNVLPSAPTDLVNLTYLQNNPPPSAVIFYFNNSQVPTPLINTYKLLAVVENEQPQSTVNTTISGIGTIQLIQGFANQLINLNGASFIPSGVWDCNFWASTVANSDNEHIAVYFSVFGISAFGVETQISVNSSTILISGTSITQYKISLALSYTDISAYESLTVKLYAICNRDATTSIINYFESGGSYSHIHTSFGVYVPPSILSLNNIFTGLNNFTQPITASISGNSATSTTSNTTLSAPDSSLSSNVVLKNGNNILSGNNTFNNLISGSISGNSATSTVSNTTLSAPDSALSSNVSLQNGNNIFSGNNTFNNLINGSISGNSATSTVSNSTLSAPDSSLSSNVVLKDAINVFTAASNTLYSNVVGSTPYLSFDNTGANLYISSARNGSPGDAPPSFTTGSFNHCIGSFSGNLITTGIENFIYGRNSLQNLTTGQRNCAFGNASLSSSATDLSYNVAMGWRSGLSLQTGGINNVFIGQSAGAGAGSMNTTNCTFLGSATRTNSTSTLFNKSTAIGADASISGSNQIVLGTPTETIIILGSLSLPPASIADSALSANVALKNGANTYTGVNGFSQIISGSITGNAGSATGIATTTNITNATYNIPFVSSVITTPAQTVYVGANGPSINPSTGSLNIITPTITSNSNNVPTTEWVRRQNYLDFPLATAPSSLFNYKWCNMNPSTTFLDTAVNNGTYFETVYLTVGLVVSNIGFWTTNNNGTAITGSQAGLYAYGASALLLASSTVSGVVTPSNQFSFAMTVPYTIVNSGLYSIVFNRRGGGGLPLAQILNPTTFNNIGGNAVNNSTASGSIFTSANTTLVTPYTGVNTLNNDRLFTFIT